MIDNRHNRKIKESSAILADMQDSGQVLHATLGGTTLLLYKGASTHKQKHD